MVDTVNILCGAIYHSHDLGEAPMEAAILVHVHPLGPSFRPEGGQALPLPTVNLPTLYSFLLLYIFVYNVKK